MMEIKNHDMPQQGIESVLDALFQAPEPEVTEEQYGEAVVQLVECALNHPDTSGGRVCGQVLLGIWNSNNWHLDIVDLCYLDQWLEAAAWTAMKGRVQLRKEPQHVINNGDLVFDQLREEFAHLSVRRRYAEHYEGE